MSVHATVTVSVHATVTVTVSVHAAVSVQRGRLSRCALRHRRQPQRKIGS